MQSAVASGGSVDQGHVQSVHAMTTSSVMWADDCSSASSSSAAAAADCRAIVPMLSGKSLTLIHYCSHSPGPANTLTTTTSHELQ